MNNKLTINLTKNFNHTIDDSNLSGLITYIDIGLTDDLINDFHYILKNFILNLNDELIKKLTSFDSNLVGKLNKNSFFVIHQADFHIEKVKGGDLSLHNLNNKKFEEIMTINRWPYKIDNMDFLYEISGNLKWFPQALLNLRIIAKGNIFMSLLPNSYSYFNDYHEFINSIQSLNKKIMIKSQPKLFNTKFKEDIINNYGYESYYQVNIPD